jgi:hypothetical protein
MFRGSLTEVEEMNKIANNMDIVRNSSQFKLVDDFGVAFVGFTSGENVVVGDLIVPISDSFSQRSPVLISRVKDLFQKTNVEGILWV